MQKQTESKKNRETGQCLLITGGSLEAAFAASCHAGGTWNHVIAADAGLKVCERAGIFPDHIVGDFDSLDQWSGAQQLLETYAAAGSVIHRFRPEKDDTDTQIGVELAMQLGCREIMVLGGSGSRLDHVLGNLQVMELALERGASMIMTDVCNRVSMHKEPFKVRRSSQYGKYISFIPWGGSVSGLTLRGFKYPLENALMRTAGSLGISNELSQDEGEVCFDSGKIIMVQSMDGEVAQKNE